MVNLNAGWREIPRGGLILDAGNSVEYETGAWRAQRPIFLVENCIQCFQCWAFCPDSSVMVRDEKVVGFDLVHCKGCGICAEICPAKPKAIEMAPENKFAGE
jgi:pyruvate ferredoxin oxidoreductase delta subunit